MLNSSSIGISLSGDWELYETQIDLSEEYVGI